MTNSRDNASLLDMAKAARLALEFVQEMSQAEFEVDIKTQSAVLYQIAILGEAVKRLSMDFRDRYPDIPWSAIAGMGDKLIHDYEGVNIQRVWLTLQTSIPNFLKLCQTHLDWQRVLDLVATSGVSGLLYQSLGDVYRANPSLPANTPSTTTYRRTCTERSSS